MNRLLTFHPRAFLAGTVSLCLLLQPEFVQAERPNVVILFTDDHGALDANCYGSTDLITPSIDELAANGIRFTQACAHKVCCPSRAALLTDLHDAWSREVTSQD